MRAPLVPISVKLLSGQIRHNPLPTLVANMLTNRAVPLTKSSLVSNLPRTWISPTSSGYILLANHKLGRSTEIRSSGFSATLLVRHQSCRILSAVARGDRLHRFALDRHRSLCLNWFWTRTFRVISILLDSETIHECQEASQDLWRPSCLSPASRLDEMVQRGSHRSGADRRH